MKSKRLFFILIAAALLLVGWMLTMKAVSGSENIRKQQELIAQADGFLEKELYVRAIPLYEEAASLKTKDSSAAEEKLLKAYQAYGDENSFLSLAKKRIQAKTATEQEYLDAAAIYLNSWQYSKAMEVLREGLANTDSEAIRDYYEENRYEYTLRTTVFQTILPTAQNTLMPAFDGEKWGYVNENGRIELDAVYEEALPFNQNGYAVVKKNGKYITITSEGAKYGLDENPASDVYGITSRHVLACVNGSYSYYNLDFECVAPGHQYEAITANSDGVAAVKKNGSWGVITDSGDVVVDFVLEDVAVNSLGKAFSGGYAMVKQNGSWFLINTKGEKQSETGYDNAKAPESDGYIAVADENGLWGYIDTTGKQMIDYAYEDALSFSEHLGAVKKNGYWGYLSERGELVIENVYSQAEPFHNGIAQVGFEDAAALIELSDRP